MVGLLLMRDVNLGMSLFPLQLQPHHQESGQPGLPFPQPVGLKLEIPPFKLSKYLKFIDARYYLVGSSSLLPHILKSLGKLP